MRTLIASTALALVFVQHASAQTEQPVEDPNAAAQQVQTAPADADDGADVGSAVGLATGAVGETFFIRMPQEYHLLTSELPGRPVYLDTTSTGMQRPTATAPEAEGTVPAEIGNGTMPLGEITDVLLDRRGGAAGLVIQLDESMRGGAREIAVAMGLVRMLPGQEDATETQILLSLDPVDLENAPNFARPGAASGEAAAPREDPSPQQEAAQTEGDAAVGEPEAQ